jgi:DNA-binding MarR family transcriptional regulator
MPPDDIGTQVVALAKVRGASKLLSQLEQGPLRGKEAAALIGKTEQRAGQVLRDLQRHGFVKQTADPSDGRASLWHLTHDGRAAMALIERATPTSNETGWILGLKLGATGKRVLAKSLLDELGPERVYRVVGDLDFVAIAHSSNASADLLADLRRRLHEAAHVEATHIGHMLGNNRPS